MSKLTMLVTGAAGYVLGTKAGRERYEQIKARASKVAQDPRVRTKAKDAGTMMKEKAPVVKDNFAGAAGSVTGTGQNKTSTGTSSSSDTGSDTDPFTDPMADPLVDPLDDPLAGPVTGTNTSPTSSYPS